jgi:thymidine kinase
MSLELILGCMFSGKSTEIVRMVDRFKTIDAKYLLVKPQIDNRYSMTMVQTHSHQQRTCEVRRQLLPLFENKKYIESEHIIIEEAQFFDDLEPFVLKAVDEDKKHVIVVGLDGDSNRCNFGQIHKLIPLCDSIQKLKAYCLSCKNGTEAIFSKRIIPGENQTYIGAADKYMAVCRECFLKE